MKHAIHNLQLFVKTERLLFTMIILCIVSSVIVIHFSYGLYQNYHVIRLEKQNDMNELVIEIVDPSRVTKRKLEDSLKSLPDDINDSVIMYMVHPVLEPLCSDWDDYFEARFTISNHQVAPCYIFQHNIESQDTLYTGRYFTPEEEASGANVAILGGDSGTNESVTDAITIQNDDDGHKIQIGSQIFDVIGENRMTIFPIIPFNTFSDETELEWGFNILMDSILTKHQYEEIRATLLRDFQDAIIIPELDLSDTEDIYLYNTILLIAAAISLLAAANFSIIYQYMLEKRRRTIAVFRICGCTKGTAIRIFLTECLIILLPLYLVSVLVYVYLLMPNLKDMFPYMAASYSLKIYFAIFLIYLSVTLCIIFLMITGQINRHTLIENKGRNGA